MKLKYNDKTAKIKSEKKGLWKDKNVIDPWQWRKDK